MTKNLLGLLALLTVLSAPASAQMGRADGKFKQPIDANGVKAQNLDFVGVAVSSVSSSGTETGNQGTTRTSARLYFAGEGVFYDLVMSSGAAGNYAACWDVAAASSVPADPFVSSNVTLVAAVQGITTSWRRFSDSGKVVPIRIRNGLACKSDLAAPTGMHYPIFEKK